VPSFAPVSSTPAKYSPPHCVTCSRQFLGRHHNVHLFYDVVFVVCVVVHWVETNRGQDFVVGSRDDGIEPFLVHMDENDEAMFGENSPHALPEDIKDDVVHCS